MFERLLEPRRIAIVGDAMTDVWVDGCMRDFLDGCPTFVAQSVVRTPGGALGAQRQLSHWNASTLICCSHALPQEKARHLVDGKIVFRVDGPVRPTDEKERAEQFESLKRFQPHGVLVSDYDKGFLTPELIAQIIAYANEKKIPVVCDAKRAPAFYKGAILKGNADYAEKFCGDLFNSDGLNGWVVTHGSGSPINSSSGLAPIRKSVQCVNHVGAGDCFSAHLTLGLACGLPMPEAVELAYSAGRVYVQHWHGRPPWPHEIQRDMTGSKLIGNLPRASMTGRMVFTNGVFRIGPHAGHSWLLRWAKAQGDVLIVGVNTDEAAAKLRPGEYVLPFNERVAMLEAQEAVDWIVPIGVDPTETIRDLKPTFLVKGSEYAGQKVPGDELVPVRFAPDGPFPERHATAIIAEIRG